MEKGRGQAEEGWSRKGSVFREAPLLWIQSVCKGCFTLTRKLFSYASWRASLRKSSFYTREEDEHPLPLSLHQAVTEAICCCSIIRLGFPLPPHHLNKDLQPNLMLSPTIARSHAKTSCEHHPPLSNSCQNTTCPA